MPLGVAQALSKASGVDIPKDVEIVSEYWHNSKAAKIGAAKRKKINNNYLFTPEQRRRSKLKRFRNLKKGNFVRPKKSIALAEFIGIWLGDGSCSRKTTSIYLNSIADKYYIPFVIGLIRNLFHIQKATSIKIVPKKGNTGLEHCSEIRVFSKWLVDFLSSMGLIRKEPKMIPKWIYRNNIYSKACVRGLFDTEGCVGFKKFAGKNGKYLYKQLIFTNSNENLLYFVYKSLKNLDFRPTPASKKNIYISNKKDIKRFVEIIRPHNPKIKQRCIIENYLGYTC